MATQTQVTTDNAQQKNKSKPPIPLNCFPDISSTVQILHELNTCIETPKAERQSMSELMKILVLPEKNKIRESSDVHYINNRCDKFRVRLDNAKLVIDNTNISSNDNMSQQEQQKLRKLRTELLEAKISYNYCIANAGCPYNMNRWVSCWGYLNNQYKNVGGVQFLIQNGVKPNVLCQQERESVERCMGHKIGVLVKVAEDSSNWD